uniref:Uncharacterized protein n=1 Tax=Pristionchus pacificus TaxID=54126 RepID=A0A2A6D1F1_PRIPA|eukprot:PDM84137.1 hypothetical protein PRIPAC_34329 [Pristionchus pacificus]
MNKRNILPKVMRRNKSSCNNFSTGWSNFRVIITIRLIIDFKLSRLIKNHRTLRKTPRTGENGMQMIFAARKLTTQQMIVRDNDDITKALTWYATVFGDIHSCGAFTK